MSETDFYRQEKLVQGLGSIDVRIILKEEVRETRKGVNG